MLNKLPDNWRSMQLTKNFSLGEFYVSDSYPDVAYQMIPSIQEAKNCYLLCVLLWQPLRDEMGQIRITSGVRHSNLNKLIGGVGDSQHVIGEAADGMCLESPTKLAYTFAKNSLKFPGELIYYTKRGHLHGALPNPWVKADHIELMK